MGVEEAMAETIKVGIIGAGYWGPNLIRNFRDSLRSEVVWVIDKDEGRLGQVQSRYPEVRTGTDAEAVFSDDSVDAVVIATPTVTHYELTRRALTCDKHVLVEKPIASNSAHARELCELAESRDRTLMVGHVFLFNSGICRIKQYLEEGELGSIYYVSMVRTGLGPIRMDTNAAWDLAAHDISIANYWLDGAPVCVSAVGGNWINEGIDDAVFATLRYPGDVLVSLHVSWLNPKKERQITVVGDRRMLTFDDMSLGHPIRIYDKQVTTELTRPTFADSFASFRASVREGDIVIPKVTGQLPLTAECEHFLESIQSGSSPRSDGRTGLSVVQVLEAMDRSRQNRGREEELER
ncbi:Gfo/Idh/MocA family oxidoreductase [Desulfobulbus sp. AH-315-M07]|nr:Gfo/Idh/MocA family oxidoreductase [Desulfobulbus sp. AH-315-M07]